MSPVTENKPHRTDPRTFAVRAITMLSQMVLPIAFGAFTILDEGEIGDIIVYLVPLAIIIIGANILVAYLQWTRLTYTVNEADIRVESGLLSRAARSVPYERIQDVSLEQKLVPRLFGLVEVQFETGAGGGDDLRLAYLAQAEGERLRELVRARRDGVPIPSADGQPDAAEAPARVLYQMNPRRVLTFGIFEFSLAVVAVVAGFASQFDMVLGIEWWNWKSWREELAGPGQWLAGLGLLAQVIGVIAALVSLLVVGVLTGIVRTILREWEFRLERTDKGLRRRRGLLTRTDLVMPVHRVQAVRLGTGIVRRFFGWHSLRLVSLASDNGSANHVAVPFAQMEEIAPVVGETGFLLPAADLQWRRAAREYRTDGFVLGFAFMAVVSVVLALAGAGAFALLPLAIGGTLTALHEYLHWRWDRHTLDATQIYARRGWLAPSTVIASREKLQSVELVRNPLARMRGYADVHFGLAGGRLSIRGLHLEQAKSVRDAALASMAEQDFSDVVETGASAP